MICVPIQHPYTTELFMASSPVIVSLRFVTFYQSFWTILIFKLLWLHMVILSCFPFPFICLFTVFYLFHMVRVIRLLQILVLHASIQIIRCICSVLLLLHLYVLMLHFTGNVVQWGNMILVLQLCFCGSRSFCH